MFAQTGSPDFLAGLRFIMRPEYSRYFLLFAGLLALLVVAAVIAAVARRSRQAGQTQRSVLAFNNLDAMKKKGLLTPEETKKIRQAMARRLMEADNQPPATVDGLESEALRNALSAALQEAAEENPAPDHKEPPKRAGKTGEQTDFTPPGEERR